MDSSNSLVGLQNPGKEFVYTRHNIGAMFVNYLGNKHNYRFEDHGSGKFRYSAGEKMMLIKNLTFMNGCGELLTPLVR